MRLILITNKPQIAKIADKCGVDWIFVDLEKIGKEERQPGLDTVKSHHHISDISKVKSSLSSSSLVVRINPLGDHSQQEIDQVVQAGADIIMLPYFKSAKDPQAFISIINKRVKTCLLIETMEAVEDIENIISIDGIDYIHIGLNDIHLQRGSNFIFEFLSDGFMDKISKKIKQKNIPFGFGGVGRPNQLKPNGERILGEHFRLGSSGVILSRAFIKIDDFIDDESFAISLAKGVREIRACLKKFKAAPREFFEENKCICFREISEVAEGMNK